MKNKIVMCIIALSFCSGLTVVSLLDTPEESTEKIEVADNNTPISGSISYLYPTVKSYVINDSSVDVTASSNPDNEEDIEVSEESLEETSVSEPIISEEPYYVQVISDGLYIRSEANESSSKIDMLGKGDKVLVKDTDIAEWLSVQIDDVWYYISKKYTTTEVEANAHLVSKRSDIIKAVQKPVVKESSTNSSNYSYTVSNQCIGSTNAAKEWIASKESGGDYNAHTSGTSYYGRYQLHYTLLNGDNSPENQERAAEEYVANRYGSWENAKKHWLSHHWY